VPSGPKQLPPTTSSLPCPHRDLSGTARGEATPTRAPPDPSSPPPPTDRPVSVLLIRPSRTAGYSLRRSVPDRAGGGRIWYGSRGGRVIPWPCEGALAFCPVWARARCPDRGVAFGSDLFDARVLFFFVVDTADKSGICLHLAVAGWYETGPAVVDCRGRRRGGEDGHDGGGLREALRRRHLLGDGRGSPPRVLRSLWRGHRGRYHAGPQHRPRPWVRVRRLRRFRDRRTRHPR
jgi:hypothetical protein